MRVVIVVFAFALASCNLGHVDTDFNSVVTAALDAGGTQFGATVDDVMWWWHVAFTDVKDTPNWTPGEEPPLPLSRAVNLAQAEIEKYTDTADAFELDSVQLLPISDQRNTARKWIYLVTFERDRARFARRGTLTIPVLLDGRVIAGKK